MRQYKLKERNLGLEHAIFEPKVKTNDRKEVVRKFAKIQNIIQESKKTEERMNEKKKLERLFSGNPYKSRKLLPEAPLLAVDGTPEEEHAPVYNSEDENCPSPRQSEYITCRSLS